MYNVVLPLTIQFFHLQDDVFKLHHSQYAPPLGSGPPLDGEITRDEMVKMYSQLSDIKELENKAGELYQEKVIRGFLHRCNGQVRTCKPRARQSKW